METQNAVFAVGKRVLAVWDPYLKQQNRQFIRAFDPDWFLYVAQAPLAGLDGADKRRAAHSIRFVYHHALETFFSLLFSTIQAPHCVPAWLGLYEVRDLVHLVGKVRNGGIVYNVMGIPRPSWEQLAQFVIRGDWEDQTHVRFAGTWKLFAQEFTDRRQRSEFNATKHGFRTAPGGFDLKVGIEEIPGTAAPADAMRSLGGSEFGSSSLVPENVDGTGGTARNPVHVRYRRDSLNWSPSGTAAKLELLVISMKNVVSTLCILNGDEAKEVEYLRPADHESFTAPFRSFYGVSQLSMNLGVTHSTIAAAPREELESIMEQATGLGSDDDRR
jgi:hypothetical protein